MERLHYMRMRKNQRSLAGDEWDEEEIYLGEIWLLEEGAYKIEIVTGDEIILRESENEDVIVLQMYGNGEYLGDFRMIEHYES